MTIYSSVDEPTVIEDTNVQLRQQSESRGTPLKSLLKKPSFEHQETSSSDSESDDGKISPKKVHFSEIDQVKSEKVPPWKEVTTAGQADVPGLFGLACRLWGQWANPPELPTSLYPMSICGYCGKQQNAGQTGRAKKGFGWWLG